jgi:hypothetical protein
MDGSRASAGAPSAQRQKELENGHEGAPPAGRNIPTLPTPRGLLLLYTDATTPVLPRVSHHHGPPRRGWVWLAPPTRGARPGKEAGAREEEFEVDAPDLASDCQMS